MIFCTLARRLPRFFSTSVGEKSAVAAQGLQEEASGGSATTGPDPTLGFDFDNDVAGLVERLNYLGTHSNESNGPSSTQEGLQLLQAARSRGMKDARVYKAAFKVRPAGERLFSEDHSTAE